MSRETEKRKKHEQYLGKVEKFIEKVKKILVKELKY